MSQFCDHGAKQDDANRVANEYAVDSPLLSYQENTTELMAVHENTVSHYHHVGLGAKRFLGVKLWLLTDNMSNYNLALQLIPNKQTKEGMHHFPSLSHT